MAFVIKKKQSFTWPVQIKSPADGGKHDAQEINLEFKKLKKSELKDLVQAKDAADEKFCKAVVIGWSDVRDEFGAEVPFSEAALSEFIDGIGVAGAVVSQYLKAFEVIEAKN